MTQRRREIGISEAQSAALYRRDHTWTEPHADSVRVAWDWRKRQPKDLREAVRMVRALYADEVPGKLHETAIGPDGTPRMTARAEGYIFGSAQSDDAARDAETGERDPVGYFHAPFRARLDVMQCGDEQSRKRAAIVSHVAFSPEGNAVEIGKAAAIQEGVPPWCAALVAQDALLSFLHSMSDLRLHLPQSNPLAESVTAA